jgi:hypothetical protein
MNEEPGTGLTTRSFGVLRVADDVDTGTDSTALASMLRRVWLTQYLREPRQGPSRNWITKEGEFQDDRGPRAKAQASTCFLPSQFLSTCLDRRSCRWRQLRPMTQVRQGWLAIKLVPRDPAVGLSGRVTNGMRQTEPSLLVWSAAASQLRLCTRHTNTLSTTGATPFPQFPQSFARHSASRPKRRAMATNLIDLPSS